MTVAPTREPQQDRSRATRAKLLEAAIESLAELGYHASTVAVVAERAGVSRGAAQHHFPTRDALFTAALEHVTHVRAEQLRHELARSDRRTSDHRRRRRHDVLALQRHAVQSGARALGRRRRRARAARADRSLEARIGREIHRVVVSLLGVDERTPGMRETVQATLDLARGLGLANLLTDDSRRRARIAAQWARTLELVAGD